MHTTSRSAAQLSPELEPIRLRCWRLAVELCDDADAAERVVAEVFDEVAPSLRRQSAHSAVETLLLGEVVRRARALTRATADGRSRSARARMTSLMPSPLWQALHERGALQPLVDRLPAPYAEAFRLRYIQQATLKEMMQRTGTSAGVITHRVAEAAILLDALTSSLGDAREADRTQRRAS